MAGARGRPRPLVVVPLVLVLVLGLAVVGAFVWKRSHRTVLDEALGAVPASSLRVGFTDWAVVRTTLGAKLGGTPDREDVDAFIAQAYDSDYAAASSIDESASALQENFGFGPATARWEAYAQGRKGATMVLKVPDGTDFDVLRDHLEGAGYTRPKQEDGVWKGGADLVAGIDPTITPELQYVSLLADRDLVVSSDDPDYAASAARVAAGDGASFSSVPGVTEMATDLDRPGNAMFWGRDFACEDLAMSQADGNDEARATARVKQAGGVTPLAGFAMGMRPDRTLRVSGHFEDSERAGKNARTRAELAVGEAIGRGVSFSDTLTLSSSRVVGNDMVLDLRPRQETGFVLSALYDGPLLFATC